MKKYILLTGLVLTLFFLVGCTEVEPVEDSKKNLFGEDDCSLLYAKGQLTPEGESLVTDGLYRGCVDINGIHSTIDEVLNSKQGKQKWFDCVNDLCVENANIWKCIDEGMEMAIENGTTLERRFTDSRGLTQIKEKKNPC